MNIGIIGLLILSFWLGVYAGMIAMALLVHAKDRERDGS